MASLRICSRPWPHKPILSLPFPSPLGFLTGRRRNSSSPFKTQLLPSRLRCTCTCSTPPVDPQLPVPVPLPDPEYLPNNSSASTAGVEDALVPFISGQRKLTELAHALWRNFVRKGDVVVDATCGNGHDTLALLKMVADESRRGCVYGMDIQDSALGSTSCLLEKSADPIERKLVKLFTCCHSKMEDVVPKHISVRLIAFNLGYLPGGDKSKITSPETTLPALKAASRILGTGGIISVMVYVGHPGGMVLLAS